MLWSLCRVVAPQVTETLQRVLAADQQNIMAQAWNCEQLRRGGGGCRNQPKLNQTKPN